MKTASLPLLCGTRRTFNFLVMVRISVGFCFVLCMYVCVCVKCLCVSHVFPSRLEEVIGSSGARVTGSCELPDVSAGNQTSVSWKCEIAPNY